MVSTTTDNRHLHMYRILHTRAGGIWGIPLTATLQDARSPERLQSHLRGISVSLSSHIAQAYALVKIGWSCVPKNR